MSYRLRSLAAWTRRSRAHGRARPTRPTQMIFKGLGCLRLRTDGDARRDHDLRPDFVRSLSTGVKPGLQPESEAPLRRRRAGCAKDVMVSNGARVGNGPFRCVRPLHRASRMRLRRTQSDASRSAADTIRPECGCVNALSEGVTEQPSGSPIYVKGIRSVDVLELRWRPPGVASAYWFLPGAFR
jgi:hypothetical protein